MSCAPSYGALEISLIMQSVVTCAHAGLLLEEVLACDAIYSSYRLMAAVQARW